jgi:hypothetical protein
MYKVLNLTAILLIGNVLSSCVFYYNTAQIDEQLKTTINQGTANYNQISSEVTQAKTAIDEMNCYETYSFIKGGKEKLNELEGSVNLLSSFNSKIITEYDNFKSYTSGIDQIGSNTPEWKKLKSTKKLVKNEISNYEKEATNTVKLAEGFQKYFDDSILPNVNYVNLKEHKEIYKNSISQLKRQLIQYESEVKLLGEKINTIIANKKIDYPDLCKQLDEKGIEIQLYYEEMKEIIETAQFTWNRFSLLNKDKEKVYSCSIDWNLIPNIQNQIADLNRELTAKQEKINANNAQIEALILQIGN